MANVITEHPDTGAPVIHLPHGRFGLGLKPKLSSPYRNRYPPVSANFPDIPQAQWTDQDFRPFCVPVLDQGQTSSCGPHALVEAMGLAFALASDEKPILSPWFVYGILEQGRDDGTALPDLLKVAEESGVPLDSLVRHGDYSGHYQQTVYQAGSRFKIEAAYNAPTFANLCSVAERRQASVIGIDIGQAFEPDANGVLPEYQQGPQTLGHALSVCGKKRINGRWYLMLQNHWRSSWGMGGFAYMPESYVQPAFGAWALRTVALDPQNQYAPPALT